MLQFRPRSAPWLLSRIAAALVVLTTGCGRERPPAPDKTPPAAKQAAAAPQTFVPSQDKALLTFAGARGQFKDTDKLEEIPDEAKGLVRIAFLDPERRPPAGKVWVTNLADPAEGGYRLQTLPRADFELAALGTGRRSAVELPPGLELPKVVQSEGVIIYKTAWCGVCTKVQQYLTQKQVQFVAKDIEKDKAAAAELAAKAKKAGIGLGSVPVIDVHGELMVGFDRGKLDQMLAKS